VLGSSLLPPNELTHAYAREYASCLGVGTSASPSSRARKLYEMLLASAQCQHADSIPFDVCTRLRSFEHLQVAQEAR
jgi:hypothetical protein